MTHDELLAAYGEEYGVEDCKFDASGVAAFDLGDDVLIYAESRTDSDALLLRCAAASVPEPDPRLMTVLLGNNYFYRGGRTGTIAAYNIATRDITLLMALDTDNMAAEDLEAALQTIADDVAYWRSVIAEGDQAWDALPGEGGIDMTRFNPLNMA